MFPLSGSYCSLQRNRETSRKFCKGERVNGPGGFLDRKIRSSGDVLQRWGGKANRARSSLCPPSRVRKYSSRGGRLHLSLEGKSGNSAGKAAADQDVAETSGETASHRRAVALLRCARIYRAANCHGIARLPCVDGRSLSETGFTVEEKVAPLILSFRGVLFAEESLFLFCKLKPRRDSSARGTPRNDRNCYFFRKVFSPCFCLCQGLQEAHRLKPVPLRSFAEPDPGR